MQYTEEQFNKLPKWAQSEIRVLKMDNSELKTRLNEYEGVDPTNTYISEGLSSSFLPNNANIEFKMGDKQEHTVRVRVNKYGLVDVNTDSRSGKDMVILPRAANSFYIDFK